MCINILTRNPPLPLHFKVLDEDLSNTTRIVIGQRSDTLLSCEQVLLLNQGRIASLGTKSELEEGGCPHYGTLRRASRLVSSSWAISDFLSLTLSLSRDWSCRMYILNSSFFVWGKLWTIRLHMCTRDHSGPLTGEKAKFLVFMASYFIN